MQLSAPTRLLTLSLGTIVALIAGCGDDAPTGPAASGARALPKSHAAAMAEEVRVLAAGRGIGPLERPAPVRPELVRLGQALAFDKILSGNRDISCMTCHLPSFGTGDG